jgi:hypothetical protein
MFTPEKRIDGLQPIPKDSNDKGLAAMLDDTNKRSKLKIVC